MNSSDKEKLFRALNAKLAENNLNLTLICVGGYVLEYHGIRGTQDVDAFFTTDKLVRRLIFEVGEENQANPKDEVWLNDSFLSMNPYPPEEICETVFEFSNLTVKIVPVEYVIGMKLESQREQDYKDVASLIELLQSKKPFDLMEKLKSYHFKTDISLVLEGYSDAYGFDWLEKFMIENEDELRKYY